MADTRLALRLVAGAVLAQLARGQDDLLFVMPGTPGDECDRIAAGDIDGDGLGDVATTYYAHTEVRIRLGQADGSFVPSAALELGGIGKGTQFVDLDGDGRLDVLGFALLPADPLNDRMVAWLGAGDGSFGGGAATLVPDGAMRASFADFDLDGDVDLLTVGLWNPTAAVLLNGGSGQLVAGPLLPTANLGAGVAADLTQDGAPDLLLNWSTGLRIWPGDGQGGFTPLPPLQLDVTLGVPLLADTDGDGSLDFISTGTPITVRRNLGHSTFSLPIEQPPGLGYMPGLVADLDEDGREDIVAHWQTDNGRLIIGLSDGASHFVPTQWTKVMGAFSGQVVAADMNGDGDLDLLGPTGQTTAPKLGVTFGLGNGLFEGWSGVDSPYELDGIAVGDLNDDGRDDAVILYHSMSVQALLAHEAGALAPAGEKIIATSAALFDANADGKLDVMLPGEQLKTRLGDGAGAFGPEIVSGIALTILARGDIDGNGVVDVLSHDKPIHNYYYSHMSGGDGTFTKVIALTQQFLANAHLLADVDGDDRVDLIRALGGDSFVTGELAFHAGDGTGAFAAGVVQLGGPKLFSLQVWDADTDGDLDLLGLDRENKQLTVLPNDGIGGFAATPIVSAIDSPAPMAFRTADFTNDGVIDACVSSSKYGVPVEELLTQLLAGSPGGTFALEQVLDTLQVGVSGDFDGDGWLDLILNGGNVRVLVVRNQRGPWNDHAHALAGAHGKPRQLPFGKAAPDAPISVALHDGPRLAPAFQVIGFAAGFTPFRGGVLVPQPDLVNGPHLTDAEGELLMGGQVPAALPAGATLWLQTWMVDDAGPQGWSASNALSFALP